MKKIYLREICLEDEGLIINLKKEIESYDNDFEGFSILKDMNDFNCLYKKLEANKCPSDINYSPQITFLAFNEEDKLIGISNIRTKLIGELINYGGNVGYIVRPSERKKGYGSKILKESLEILKKYGLKEVVLGCRIDNIASSKVIENNGGIFSNNYYEKKNNKTFKKYIKKIM